ncbi:MAG: hypothetical protein CMJ78_15955 [Planctomycetaceae bacterium]|nr:hypothetical protein [Planctomycetaceae bacterium]
MSRHQATSFRQLIKTAVRPYGMSQTERDSKTGNRVMGVGEPLRMPEPLRRAKDGLQPVIVTSTSKSGTKVDY